MMIFECIIGGVTLVTLGAMRLAKSVVDKHAEVQLISTHPRIASLLDRRRALESYRDAYANQLNNRDCSYTERCHAAQLVNDAHAQLLALADELHDPKPKDQP